MLSRSFILCRRRFRYEMQRWGVKKKEWFLAQRVGTQKEICVGNSFTGGRMYNLGKVQKLKGRFAISICGTFLFFF